MPAVATQSTTIVTPMVAQTAVSRAVATSKWLRAPADDLPDDRHHLDRTGDGDDGAQARGPRRGPRAAEQRDHPDQRGPVEREADRELERLGPDRLAAEQARVEHEPAEADDRERGHGPGVDGERAGTSHRRSDSGTVHKWRVELSAAAVQRGAPMRVAELSRRTDVSVASIKYYLREGLLPAGERTGPNQADVRRGARPAAPDDPRAHRRRRDHGRRGQRGPRRRRRRLGAAAPLARRRGTP